jgi:LacI family transcriptional regulator
MKEKVRVQDIAKVLNISASTVSRALNNHPRISKETKEKVKHLASRMGYRPGVVDSMNPEKAEAVVVLVPNLESELYRELVAGVTEYMNKFNFQTFVIDTNGDENRVNSFFKSYKKYGISGIVHFICNRNISSTFYSVPVKDALPMVNVFEPDVNVAVSSVLPDMFQGISKITRYLKSVEVSRIALILEKETKPEDFQIASTFKSALEMEEMDVNELSIQYLSRAGVEFVKKVEMLLKGKDCPQTILVKGKYAAMEIMNICERLKIKIPEDILLIAISADSNSSVLTSNLSLLKLPAHEMGNKAAQLVMDQIHDVDTEKKTAIKPASFILKGSAIRMKTN